MPATDVAAGRVRTVQVRLPIDLAVEGSPTVPTLIGAALGGSRTAEPAAAMLVPVAAVAVATLATGRTPTGAAPGRTGRVTVGSGAPTKAATAGMTSGIVAMRGVGRHVGRAPEAAHRTQAIATRDARGIARRPETVTRAATRAPAGAHQEDGPLTA